MDYLRPRELGQALGARAEGGWTILAGGTDHFPARVTHVPNERILDITGIAALRGIEHTASGTRIGACTTWSDIARADLPSAFDGLKAAALEVGGRQVQNRGTLAGNLCNASPAADGVPALISLEAEVEVAGQSGTRRMPLEQFILGNRRTALGADELVTAVHVPPTPEGARSAFVKLGARHYLVISIVMAAGVIKLAADGRIARTRLVVGACSEVAQRLLSLEEAMVGLSPEQAAALDLHPHLGALSPIDDVRASADYRQQTSATVLTRCIAQACGDAP